MFAITVAEAGVLLIWVLGVVSALVGRAAGVLTLREALIALAAAVLLPVVGSLIAVAMVVSGWRQHRRASSAASA